MAAQKPFNSFYSEDDVAINYTSAGQGLTFSDSAGLTGQKQISVGVWINPTSCNNWENTGTGSVLTSAPASGAAGSGIDFYLTTSVANSVSLTSRWSTGYGGWQCALPSLNVNHLIGFTYDGSSTTNDPIIYIDGVATSFNASAVRPTGTWSGLHARVDMGNRFDNEYAPNLFTFKGKHLAAFAYGRILTASEMLAAYNNGLTASPVGNYVPSQDNLIFRPNLMCAKSLNYVSFVGTVLGSSNKIVEMVGCAEGTPTGSPVGA